MGILKDFNLEPWKKLYSRFATTTTNFSLLKKLRIIHITIDKLSFFKQQFNAITVKAKIVPNHDWSFNLQQISVSADLTYHVPTNELNGHAHYLRLAKISSGNDLRLSTPIHPNQIPNLNLRIDNLSVGKVQIGDVTLKSQSTEEQFLLKYCRVDSPVYQFNIKGEWTQKAAKNHTKLDLNLTINNLGKTLDRWGIMPAVEAKKGYMEFHGNWNQSIYQLALSSLNGTIYLQLKNGIITADRELVDRIATADLVHLPGGDPDLVPTILGGTPALEAMHGAWRRGGVLAGASAGAMALADWTWTPHGGMRGPRLRPRSRGRAALRRGPPDRGGRHRSIGSRRVASATSASTSGPASWPSPMAPSESWVVAGPGAAWWFARGSNSPLVAHDGERLRLPA